MVSTRAWLPQFSLRCFLIGVAVVSVGLAGVLGASEGWAFALGAAFHLLLPIALVLAIARTGEPRMFWIGVVIASTWCHVLLGTTAVSISQLSVELSNHLDNNVATSIVSLHESRVEREAGDRLDAPRMQRMSPAQAADYQARMKNRVADDIRFLAATSVRRFTMILLSLGGGCLAAWAYRFRKQDVPSSSVGGSAN